MCSIFIDGDSCKVLDETEIIAKDYGIPCHIYCDSTRMLYSDYSSIHIVDKGRDSADFAILKACSAGDIVVTSDGGLAAMALAKNCAVISPSGIEYTNDNISLFLNRRYMRRKSAKNPGKHRSYSVKLPDCKNLSKHVSYKIMLKNTICRLDEKN